MKCPKCGVELKEEAKYCKSCGSKITETKKESQKQVEEDNANFDEVFNEIVERLKLLLTCCKKKQATIEQLEKQNSTYRKKIEKMDELLQKRNEVIQKYCIIMEKQQKEIDTLKAGNISEDNPGEKITVCPKCKSKVDENTIFCGECGTKIR